MEILFLSLTLAGVVVGSELSDFVDSRGRLGGDAADCGGAAHKLRVE